jgi:AMP-polyphosphate phosphotransferase
VFETAEIGHKLAKSEFEKALPELRAELLKAQTRLESADFPVLVLINGADGAGKGDTLNRLYEWLDARYLTTFAYREPTEEERQRPEYWRYWMALPRAGRMTLFYGNWYSRPILDRVHRKIDDGDLAQALTKINSFERALTDDGALLIKLWFHLSKKEQRRRLERLERSKSTRWRVRPEDWQHHALYSRFVRVCDGVLRETSSGEAPWHVIEATDDRYRDMTAARVILDALRARLERGGPPHDGRSEPAIPDPHTILDTLDLSKSIEKEAYATRIPLLQGRLNKLARRLNKKKRSAIFLFEGFDAAGKGGAIRRIAGALDARQYSIIPIAAPTEEERAHHHLWRFWRHLPRRGRITIYDRSWYGRVLVERVEGFTSEAAWRRAYKEINDFEEQLTSDGIILIKFWLQIGADEQLKRFQARENEPWKQHKIGPEDYRNREKTPQYEAAAEDMIEHCSTRHAPFVLVEANDKRHARVKVLETICDRLEAELG